MKKCNGFIILLLCVSFLLSGCGEIEIKENVTIVAAEEAVSSEETGDNLVAKTEESPSVIVVSGNENYVPVENFTFSNSMQTDSFGKKQEVTACGVWLNPQDVEMMPQVPWSEDMRLDVTGEALTFKYSFYDNHYEVLEKEKTGTATATDPGAVIFPESQEPYYVKLEFSFQYGESRVGYQYFFQMVFRAPSPVLSVAVQTEDSTIEVSCAKGRGAFQSLVKDGLTYIPIGSRLSLSFPENGVPVSVKVFDFVLSESGEPLTTEEEKVEPRELRADGEAYSIYLGTNLEAMEYGYSDAYKPGGIRRGFLMECMFEDGSREIYVTALKTDAAFGIEDQPSSAYLMPMCGTGVEVFAESRPRKGASGLRLIFVMDNASTCDFIYGGESRLYRFDGPEQKEVPIQAGAGWEDLAYILEAGKTQKLDIDLEQLYGSLRPGYYRFSKELIRKEKGDVRTVSGDFVVN